jgi:uncharacterized alkaline shock family protein YloU
MSKIPIKIKGKVQDLQKKEREKILNSNFLLTINTNQRYPENDKDLENDIEVFDSTIQNILNNVGDYINLPSEHKFDEHFIKDVDIDYTIERGNKNGQLHIHLLMKFKHKTKIQLNYEKIKEKIKTDLGLTNIYMYNKLVRNSGNDNILDYLNKYT